MSLEKLYSENLEKNKEKKSLNEKERFLKEKKILQESADLLNALAKKIATDFWLNIFEVKEYIKWNTLGNLKWLKDTFWNNIDTQDFKNALQQARKTIEELSKKHREKLKESIFQDDASPDNFEYYITKRYFSQYRQRALYPEKFSDHIMGIWLGMVDTSEAIALFLYGLWKWFLLTPYHIYLVITWKAKFENWKRL